MATIKEDYVSFETAKLLKEKGFEGFTMFSYSNRGSTMCGHWENETDWLPKCTLQMAMKWLREVHDIYIDISIYVITKNTLKYNINVYYKKHKNDSMYLGIHLTKEYTKYEKACETAVLYCLENLI
jgi:hypothetical protein